MSTENTLEIGYKSLIEALTYITANSIPVEQHEDNSKDLVLPMVAVRCMPLSRIAPNAPYYISGCEFTCVTYIADDKDRSVLKDIYNDIFNFAISLTSGELSTETGLTIDGLVVSESGDEERDDNNQILTIKINTYLTK